MRDDSDAAKAREYLMNQPRASEPQPPPSGAGTEVLPLVIADFQARAVAGFKKYGTPLRANNGRSALLDAYQEAQDLVMYLRQKLEEESQEKKP